MKYLALCLALTGCCSGVDPSQVAPSAPAAYQAVGPQERVGLTEGAYGAVTLLPSVADCALEAGGGFVVDAITSAVTRAQQFLRCVKGKIPTPVVPIQTAPAAAPKAAPCAPVYRAPAAKECATNGTCPR